MMKMRYRQIGVWTVLSALLLATGCKEDEKECPPVGPTGESALVIQYDWVETPKEAQLPKGTTLLVYEEDRDKPEYVETGLDGYVIPEAEGSFDLVVCNRDLVNAVVEGEDCPDSLSFRLLSTAEGFLKEPGWLLAGMEKGVVVKEGKTVRRTVKMLPFAHRIVLRDVNMNDASVISYTGALEGLATGIRLGNRTLLSESGTLSVHFEKTDSGWVSSFLSPGIHPDYSCRLTRVVTLSDGSVRQSVLDLTQQAFATMPKEPGQTQLIEVEGEKRTVFDLRATAVSLSGDYLLLGTEKGVYVSHYGGDWAIPEPVGDPLKELGRYPIRSVVLSGTNGLVADTKDRCWWLTKTATGWQATAIPVPMPDRNVKEVTDFGAALTINGNYAAISAPGSTIGVFNEEGSYIQYDKAGAVYLYPIETLTQGKFSYRLLLLSPLTAMTGYGQSLALDTDNRIAIGINKNIRSYSADFIALSAQGFKRIPYEASPALGCPFVLADGGMMLAGTGTSTFQYTLSGNTLVPVHSNLPVIEGKDIWSLSGKQLVIKGLLYQLTDKEWELAMDLSAKLPAAEPVPAGWGKCSSLNGNRVAVCSDENVYIFNF